MDDSGHRSRALLGPFFSATPLARHSESRYKSIVTLTCS